MELNEQQISFYHDNGYLLLENYLSKEEVEILSAELPKTIDRESPRIILEDNGSVRSIFAPHFVNDTYARLSRLNRLVLPAEQLIDARIYVHQYKINTKKGLKGDWWEWHQDFPYWHIDDGIKTPDMVSVLIYLQDTDSSNGALMLIPGSHKLGIVKFAKKEALLAAAEDNDYRSSLNADIKFTVDHDLIKELSIANGIITTAGSMGSVLFFHGNIFHASNSNLTPFDRDAILITYNSIDNVPQNKLNPRPDFLAGRDYAPIENPEVTL